MEPGSSPEALWGTLQRKALESGAAITAPRLEVRVMKAEPIKDTFVVSPPPTDAWGHPAFSLVEVTEERLDPEAVERAIAENVVTDPAFEAFVNAIQNTSGAETKAVQGSVIHALEWAAFYGELQRFPASKAVVEDVTNYHSGKEFGHHTIFWLRGVRVPEQTTVFPGFSLRPSTLRDIENAIGPRWGMTSGLDIPWADSIGEYEFESHPWGHAQMREYAAIRFLRMTTGASISWSIAEHRLRTPLTNSGMLGRSMAGREAVAMKVTLSSNDVEAATWLWGRLSLLLKDPRRNEESPFGIAMDRWEKSLLLPGTVDQRNLWAVMGLEALLLEGGADLTRAFRQRCSLLGEAWGMDPLDVDERAHRAYTARSKFVHGQRGWPKSEAQQIKDDTNTCSEILRRLLLYLLLKPTEKKPFIKALDRAFISENERDQLLKELREPGDELKPVGVLESG